MTPPLTLLVGGTLHGMVIGDSQVVFYDESVSYHPFVIDPPGEDTALGRFRVHVHESLLDVDRADDLRRYLLDAALRAAGLPQAQPFYMDGAV